MAKVWFFWNFWIPLEKEILIPKIPEIPGIFRLRFFWVKNPGFGIWDLGSYLHKILIAKFRYINSKFLIQYAIFVLLALFIYLIPDRDWDLARKIQIESYLLNEVLNSNIDEERITFFTHNSLSILRNLNSVKYWDPGLRKGQGGHSRGWRKK